MDIIIANLKQEKKQAQYVVSLLNKKLDVLAKYLAKAKAVEQRSISTVAAAAVAAAVVFRHRITVVAAPHGRHGVIVFGFW